jgi:hypothetical protein
VLFYQVQASSVSPKPAGVLIGSFTLDGAGHLTYQAGPLLDAARITSISSAAANDDSSIISVGFNSKAAVKYRLLYSTQLTLNRALWTVLPNPVAGNGSLLNLYDSSPTDAARFYTVESY